MGKDNAQDLFEKIKDRPVRPSASYAAAAGAGGAYGSFAMASCCGAFLRCARVLFAKVNLESLESMQPAFLRELSVRGYADITRAHADIRGYLGRVGYELAVETN